MTYVLSVEYFCSDAQSRFKSSQTIWGLRNSKYLTEVHTHYLHFNASAGEGKRSETDGHNTDNKAKCTIKMAARNNIKQETEESGLQAICLASYPRSCRRVTACFLYNLQQTIQDSKSHDISYVCVFSNRDGPSSSFLAREEVESMHKPSN
jgi:hypothetical protein